MKKKIFTKAKKVNKPNLPKRLFWEFRFDEMDWLNSAGTVIDRVIERGSLAEWQEIIRFYGAKKVINNLKKETPYLSDRAIKKACDFFNLKPEELRCYLRKQSSESRFI